MFDGGIYTEIPYFFITIYEKERTINPFTTLLSKYITKCVEVITVNPSSIL